MSEIQECYWLIPFVRAEYSRKCFGIITPSTIVYGSIVMLSATFSDPGDVKRKTDCKGG